jgi:hypoxanthine phosphoribosyltransferase
MSDIATVLFTEEEIGQRVRELAEEITRDYAGRSPVLVTVLKGAVLFLADLFRQIDLPARIDFMSISPYGRDSEEAGGVVRIMKDLDQDIGGEDVVVVEDIVDTGLTLSYLLTTLWSRQPRSIEVCALLDKSVRRIPNVDIRYRGFDCPDKFVVGYGLDHGERYRNLPAILSVEDRTDLGERGEAFDQLLLACRTERPVAP